MKRRSRRNHSAAFKAKVGLAAVRRERTLAKLAKQFHIHANQIADWKNRLLQRASDVFGDPGKREAPDVDVKTLHAKIGQLTLENDFFKHALDKAGLLGARK